MTPLQPPAADRAAPARRDVLRGGAAAAVVAAGGLSLAPAADAAYRPARYRGARLLGAADRHLATRTSYGLTPRLTRQVRAAGGGRAWFERQLRPGRVADPAGDALLGWWPSLRRSPQDLWRRQQDDVESGWSVMADYQRWLLLRRVTTNRQVAELMTELWMHHFHVPVHADGVFTHRFSYDQTVRAHALGRFSDLLQAVTVHPAMGIYLDNATSTKRHPNENLGRELLELHTVGRGAYTEDDVKSSSRILTGYLVDMWRTWEATYSPRDHWTGQVRVGSFSHANADPDGRAVARAYLDHLARRPETARRVVRKICVKLVSDAPSTALVERLARVYLDNDTAIVPVLRALVSSTEFKRSAGRKVRDPGEDVVATYRALGVRVDRPTGEGAAADAILWQTETIGALPHDWPRPDGQPLEGAAWASPARMLASFDVHWSMAGGWWPRKGARYRTPEQWLPQRRVRFDVLVDHLCQQLLGRRSTTRLLKACCQSTGLKPGTVITRDHGLVRWDFPRLLAPILDSPEHLTR